MKRLDSNHSSSSNTIVAGISLLTGVTREEKRKKKAIQGIANRYCVNASPILSKNVGAFGLMAGSEDAAIAAASTSFKALIFKILDGEVRDRLVRE